MSHVIQGKVNDALKKDRIKEVRIRAVDFSSSKQKVSKEPKRYGRMRNEESREVPLSMREKKALCVIESNELRTELKKFCVRCKRRGSRYGEKR
jgi:hypothetical protein